MSGRIGTSPGVEKDDDNWHHIEDAKERKKIQDRLAQRARRKRLREAKERAKISTVQPAVLSSEFEWNDHSTFSSGTASTFNISISSTETLELIPSFDSSSVTQPFSSNPTATQTYSMNRELSHPLNFFSALYVNGHILGIKCRGLYAAKSAPASEDVPPPLQPTATQIFTVHFDIIDRFPFPKLRDNFITMSAVIDEEEFLMDCYTMPTFTILPGYPAWDPTAWRVEPPFLEKWGFLLY